MNMNRVTPSVPRPESTGSDASGNTAACACGHQAPNTSGPSSRPAAISPITGGCPTWRSTAPQALAAASTRTSCRSSSRMALIAAHPRMHDGCTRRAGFDGDLAPGSLQYVDEAVDRQPPRVHVCRRHPVAVDIARVQRIAPIHDDAVVHAIDAADALEQRRVAVDVPRTRRVRAPAFLLQGLEVMRAARLVHVLVAGRAMAVERGAAPVAAEQVVHRRQPVALDRVDVRYPLQEHQL